MSKLVLVVALLGIAACGPKPEQPPAVDTAAAPAPAPVDTTVKVDSMARDTTRDTTKTP